VRASSRVSFFRSVSACSGFIRLLPLSSFFDCEDSICDSTALLSHPLAIVFSLKIEAIGFQVIRPAMHEWILDYFTPRRVLLKREVRRLRRGLKMPGS
jgi:hypothetical protein